MPDLTEYRAEIDRLDAQIVDALVARFKVVEAIGAFKAQHNISVVQPERAEHVKARVAARAAAQGLDGQLLRQIYDLIIEHAHVIEVPETGTHGADTLHKPVT